MWELEDWKDLSKMLENFAEAALALVGIFLVLKWLAKHKDWSVVLAMWDLDDWKDFAEVVKNFAQTAFIAVAIFALLKWASRDKR
jgi:hypothetical protein